jgi:hypothetical protein
VIGVGIALIVLGLIFLLVVPWVGIPVGLVGLVLAVLWVAGFGRGGSRADTTTQHRL